MTPTGLKVTGFSHGLGRFPATGSSGPGLSKGQTPPANDAPVIPIGARLGPNGLLTRIIARDGCKATVVRSVSGRVLAVCQFPKTWILDPCLANAKPTIEIVGSDGLAIKCDFIGIVIGTEGPKCLVISFRPRSAYVLNTDAGPGEIWPAVARVDVHTGDNVVGLVNSVHDPDTELRKTPRKTPQESA